MPGLSVPVGKEIEDGKPRYLYSFTEHVAWPLGALNRFEQSRLAESIQPILSGLSALHDAGIHYGRISRQTFCDRGTPGRPLPMLHIDPSLMSSAGVVSGGHAEERFWIADRVQSQRAPTAGDDLYALGVVLAEMILGPARMDGIWAAVPDKANYAQELTRNLNRTRGCLPLKNLANWLLESANTAGRNAADGIAILSKAQNRRSYAKIVLSAGLAIFAFSYFLNRSNNRAKIADERAVAAESLLEERDEEIESRDIRIRELKSKLRDAEDQQDPEPVPRQGNPGRVFWDGEVANDSVVSTLANFTANADQATGDDRVAINDWAAKLQSVLDANPRIDRWFANDRPIREMVKLAINRPWEADFALIRQRSLGLNEAYRTWTQWGESSNSFNDLSRLHSRMASGVAKDVLGRWLNEIESLTTLKLQVSTGKSDNAAQKEHSVYYRCGDVDESKKWIWNSSQTSGNPIDFRISPYQAGEPIKIWLAQTGYLYNSYVIDIQLDGPLFPWVFAKPKFLVNEDSGYQMTIKVLNAVGPPHFKSIPDRANLPVKAKSPSSKQGSAPTTDDRPKYDPAKQLPLP